MATITETWDTADTGGSLSDAAYAAWDVILPLAAAQAATGPIAQYSVLTSRAASTVIKVATASEPTGAGQEFEAFVAGASNLDGNGIIIWNRFDTVADYDPTVPTVGYGLSLGWNTDGTRPLSLIKINKATAALELLATLSNVTLDTGPGGTDIGYAQLIRLVTVTLGDGSVLVRGYVNQDDDSDPTIEAVDRGQVTTGASATMHLDAGTYAITLSGTSTVSVDRVTVRDDYVLSGFSDYKTGRRTLSELRTNLKLKMDRGIASNLSDEYLNTVLNDAVEHEMDDLADLATFTRKMRTEALTEDAAQLVTLPYDVDTIIDIYDASSNQPVEWRLIHVDSANRAVIHMPRSPGGESYQILYNEKWEPMEEDTDECVIPQRFDEIVVLGALLRVGTADRDARYTRGIEELYRARKKAVRKKLNSRQRNQKAQLHVRAQNYSDYSRYGRPWQRCGPF